MKAQTPNPNLFNFFSPIGEFKKSKKEEKDVYYFKGKASDSSKDSDGENLSPDIFDFSEFKYVNWDHGKQPGDIIGEKIGVEIKNGDVLVEGIIYPQIPKGKDTIQLMETLQKSPNGNRLGISVEGEVLERDLLTKMPTRAKVTSIALCPFPKNGNTWAQLIEKSKNGESLYQKTELLEYEEPEDCLLYFADEKGNSIEISKDFNFKIKKSQSTENSSSLISEDVEKSTKILKSAVSLVKAHKLEQISDEILEKVKEKVKNGLSIKN